MKRVACAAAVLLLSLPQVLYSQTRPRRDGYVSREEYLRLQEELESLKAQMRQMQRVLTPAVFEGSDPKEADEKGEEEKLQQDLDAVKSELKDLQTTRESYQAEVDETIEELEKELRAARDQAQAASPGSTRFLITGYGFAGIEDRDGENSSFNAGFNPIFLWKLSDRIFFEGELEVELEHDEAEFDLEYAHLTYLLNDCITVGVGKFLTPFGIFPERLHPAWINKLPDFPLAFGHDGLVPFTSLGVQLRGGVPFWCSKLNYAFYFSNGPELNIEVPNEAGNLHFENFEDINNNKAFGGRIGLLLTPELEVGHSFQVARVGPSGTPFSEVDAVLVGLDATYVQDIDWLKGRVDVRHEWIWSDVDDATFDPDGSLGFGPVSFDNRRNGGYVQVAYRPSKVEHHIIKNLEPVVRYDMLHRPAGAPEEFDEQRVTIGLNYWLGPSMVFKVAYQFDDKDSGEEDQDALLFQAALGF
ncbi:MAG: hypothetical protein HY000_04020 [Planctomycetes bacterium]|nr:hypothetical protein [Planctomycetota bacterium]